MRPIQQGQEHDSITIWRSKGNALLRVLLHQFFFLRFLCRKFQCPPGPLVRVTSPVKKERESCDLRSALHNTNAVSFTCSAKTPPSGTMINVFPAESTQRASIWSSRVSTPSTGVTTAGSVWDSTSVVARPGPPPRSDDATDSNTTGVSNKITISNGQTNSQNRSR